MSAFGIFALILTTVYIIYFSVVIIRDVISSRKSAEDNSGAETFDTIFAGEQSVEVVETETGFAVGDNNVNAESVAAIESLKQEPPFSEADKEDQALAIQERLDADAQDVEQDRVYEKVFTDEEFDELLQGTSGQIDNAGCLITRIPAGESAKTKAEDAPVVDEY